MDKPQTTPLTDENWAKCIIMHLTGRPDDPTPLLLQMIASIRREEHEKETMPKAD